MASYETFGSHPFLWHGALLLWGTLTCYLLYLAVRMLGADIASATVFVLLLVLSGSQNWIWIDLVPAETFGMLMTGFAVWAIVVASRRPSTARWHVLVLVAVALAGLAKESFVLLIPALLALHLTCHRVLRGGTWRQSAVALNGTLAVGAIIFVIEIGLIGRSLLVMPAGYGASAAGLSLASFDPRQWLQLLSVLPLNVRIVLAVTPFVWAGIWLAERESGSSALAAAAVLVLWMAPQLVLYKNSMQERYLFPLVLGVAAVISLSLAASLRIPRLRLLWPAGVIVLLPPLVAGVPSTTGTVGSFVAETKAANRMITFVAQNVPVNETILMAGDAGTPYGFEAAYSLPMYLKVAGSNSPFYLWPLISKGERSPMHIAASRDNTAFRYPDSLSPAEVGAIIIVDKWVSAFDYDSLRRWLGDTKWREVSFTEPYGAFSLRPFGYTVSGEVTHRILLSTASRGVPSERPLVAVDRSLMEVVTTGPLLETPSWGLERDGSGAGTVVWIGQGEEEGVGGDLSSTQEQPIEMDLQAIPGPSRPGPSRTVELRLDNRSGLQTRRNVFDGDRWRFSVTLEPGINHFRLEVLDEATVAVQPNGDTRHLMALLRQITVRPSAHQ